MVVVVIVIVVVMIMMVPSVMGPKISVVPVSTALVVTPNPVVMVVPMTWYPDVMQSPVPELWTVVIRAIADADFKRDRLCRRI